MIDENASRRALIAGAGAVGLTGVLAACGGDETPTTSTPTTNSETNTTPTAGSGNTTLAKKSDIPVGGAKAFSDDGVIIAQPTSGQFLGFSNICTHQSCVLTKIQGDTITCGCHQSQFSTKDGSVKNGPANKSLEKVTLKIDGDNILLG